MSTNPIVHRASAGAPVRRTAPAQTAPAASQAAKVRESVRASLISLMRLLLGLLVLFTLGDAPILIIVLIVVSWIVLRAYADLLATLRGLK